MGLLQKAHIMLLILGVVSGESRHHVKTKLESDHGNGTEFHNEAQRIESQLTVLDERMRDRAIVWHNAKRSFSQLKAYDFSDPEPVGPILKLLNSMKQNIQDKNLAEQINLFSTLLMATSAGKIRAGFQEFRENERNSTFITEISNEGRNIADELEDAGANLAKEFLSVFKNHLRFILSFSDTLSADINRGIFKTDPSIEQNETYITNQ